MKNFKNALVLHKLAITRAVLFSLVTLGSTWQVATDGEDIGAYRLQEWVKLFIAVFVLWGNQMLSFFDNTIKRMTEGKPPLPTGGTEFLAKQPENG